MMEGQLSGFIVRLRVGDIMTTDALRASEEIVRAIRIAHVKASESSVQTRVPIEFVYSELLSAAYARVAGLQGPCLAADVCVTHALPLSSGTQTLIAQTLSGVPLVAASANSEVLWQPPDPDAHPELLVTQAEAVHLVRSFEPSVERVDPLPPLRARALPLRASGGPGTLLGTGTGFGGPVDARLDGESRLRHVYVVGQTGTGKSTLLLNMALSDIDAGYGVTVLDPHGSLIDDLLVRIPQKRIDDVLVIDPGAGQSFVPLNPLVLGAVSAEEHVRARDQAIDDLIDVFDALYDLRSTGGPIFEQGFRAAASTLVGSGPHPDFMPSLPMLGAVMLQRGLLSTLEDRLLPIDAATKLMLAQLRQAKGEMALESLAIYVASKVNRFYATLAARRTLCQGDHLDLSSVLTEHRIVLVKLPWTHLGREGAALIARLLIGRLTREAMARGPGRGPEHFIYADEFHQFATERFGFLLAEARKFRVGLVLAHQHTSQLATRGDSRLLDAILGNVSTVIAFRLGLKDADLLEPTVRPLATARDIASLPNYRAIARISSSPGASAFTLDTQPPRVAEIARRQPVPAYGKSAEEADADIARNLAVMEELSTQKQSGT
jgi:hypothetical protein